MTGSRLVAWRVLLVAVFAVGGVAACGGGDDDADDDAAPVFEREETTTTEEEETTTTTEEEETTTTVREEEPSGEDGARAEAIATAESQAGDVAIFACGAAESNPDVDPVALGTALDNTYFLPVAQDLVGLAIAPEEAAQILVDALTDALQERCPDVADVILGAVSG